MTVDPAGVGVTLLHVTIVMLVLCWATVIARLSVRRWLKPDAMGADDYLMVAGLLLYTVTCCLVIICCFYGAGQLAEALDPATIMQGTKLFFVAELFYAACTALIKSSICVTLLRIADARRRFTWTLWATLAAAAMAAVVFIICVANICHPITTLWGETTTGECNPHLNSSVSFFFSAIAILTDFTLAIVPVFLLWNVQMNVRVKISVILMLSLATFASCATIIRLRYLTLYNNQAEFMFSTGQVGLWSVIEEGIGITAGSMASLRPLLSLRMFGWATSRNGSGGRSGQLPSAGTFGDQERGPSHNAIRMNSFEDPASANRSRKLQQQHRVIEDGDSDGGDSQRKILKETHVQVTTEYSLEVGHELGRDRVLGWKSPSAKGRSA